MPFEDLHLSDALLKAVADAGYTEPSAIQAAAIPAILMQRDIIGVAQTGTGKTASFVLPMIDILAEGRSRALMPRSLILEPTRELAQQVSENFDKYGKYHKLSMALLIGGVSMGDQLAALERGVDVLIATPGRLMDLFGRGKIMLGQCGLLVIDEADRMLDMGFIPDVEEICRKLPAARQTLLFSATMPPPIKKLADQFMTNPKMIEVSRPATTNADIAQSLMPTDSRAKRDVLKELLRTEEVRTAIIFCNRKTTVRDLASSLKRSRFKVGQIHGDMEQADRIRELDRFKAEEINILVASDVAARGLDIKGVSHVFNYDAPWHPDDYVHRIGRTGRAGMKGIAITLVTPEDEEAIQQVQKLIGQTIPRRKADGAAPVPATPSEPAGSADAGAAPATRASRGRKRSGGAATPAHEAAAPAVQAAEQPQARADEGPPGDRRRPRAARAREERPREERPREEHPREEQPREAPPPRGPPPRGTAPRRPRACQGTQPGASRRRPQPRAAGRRPSGCPPGGPARAPSGPTGQARPPRSARRPRPADRPGLRRRGRSRLPDGAGDQRRQIAPPPSPYAERPFPLRAG